MTDQPRPVWLTREQRDHLERYWPVNGIQPVNPIVAAWDAAPADPTEAIRKLIANESYYFGSADPLAVLRALGMP